MPDRNVRIMSVVVALLTIIGLFVVFWAVSNNPTTGTQLPRKSAAARMEPSTVATPTISQIACVPKDHFCLAIPGVSETSHVRISVKTTLGKAGSDAYGFGDNIHIFTYKPLTGNHKEAVRSDLSWGWNPQETEYAGHFAIKTHIRNDDGQVDATLKVYYKGKMIVFTVIAPKGMKQANAAINSLRLT